MNNHFNRELLDRRTFIKGFIKEITVRGNDRRIKYALPLPPDNIKEENLKVLPIVQYSGRSCTVARTFEVILSL